MRRGFEAITDFIFMEDALSKANVILIPGGSHKELIHRAVELYKAGYADYILPSGGANPKLKNHSTECDFLVEEAIRLGIPKKAILKEDKAAHTFENASLSYKVLEENSIDLCKVILVCKNFHSRRAYISYKLNFPRECEFIVQPVIDSTGISKENWTEDETYRARVLGEVRKIGEYFNDHIANL